MPTSPISRRVREADLYDVIAGRQRGQSDVPIYLAMAALNPGPVLELGTGTGRVLIPLIHAGLNAIGLENDLGRIQAGLTNLMDQVGTRASSRLVHGDMTEWRAPATFSLIIAPFNVLSLLDDGALNATLDSCRINLLAGGQLVFEAQCWPREDDPAEEWQFGPTEVEVGPHAAIYSEGVRREGRAVRVQRRFTFRDGSFRETSSLLHVRSRGAWARVLEDQGWELTDQILDERGGLASARSKLLYVRATPRS